MPTKKLLPPHRICSISFVGGFLDGMDIKLDPKLNCLIGSRGAGKTTVLEAIRYAFNALPTNPDEKKRLMGLIQKNIGGGRVRVTIETRENLRYVISRSGTDLPVVLDSNNKPTDIAVNGNGLFSLDIFSQNQVEGIADCPASQLDLLDSFREAEIQSLSKEIKSLSVAITSNATECMEANKAIAAIADELATLPSIEERLKEIREDTQGDNTGIDDAHARKAHREREKRALASALDLLEKFSSQIQPLIGFVEQRAESIFDPDALSGENSECVKKAHEGILGFSASVEGHLESIREALDEAHSNVSGFVQTLSEAHILQNQVFDELLAQHKEAMGMSQERTRLESKRNELLVKKKLFDEASGKLTSLGMARSQMLASLCRLRQKRFDLRKEIADHISDKVGPTVKVEIEQCGDVSEYQALLEASLKSAGVQHRQVASKIADRVTPPDLVEAIRHEEPSILIDRGELNREQARKVLDALTGTPTVYQLESVEIGDKPSIRLKDGDQYKDSLSLSTGQKCTCILPILLLDSEKPLLVDQPEDNLDNRFVFDTVVKRIRDVKESRQLLFITHNPNIPVLGMAESVVVLASSGAQAEVQHSGPVDQCRDQIVTLLEGGQEAFMERKNRYGF